MKTNIYFLVAEELSLVKIGKARNVEKRVTFIQTASPVELELVSVLRSVEPTQENLIHSRFDGQRTRGEWFKLNDELREFVNAPVIIGPDKDTDWRDCKVFVSWYADTDEAREDAILLENKLFADHNCTDTLTGDPEWNYMSACKCILWSDLPLEMVKLAQSRPSGACTWSELPEKDQAKLALVPDALLNEWLSNEDDWECRSFVIDEHNRRQLMRTNHPWIANYARWHSMEREQVWQIICKDSAEK